jgi:F-type H+-transporting ATPase subunit gamma
LANLRDIKRRIVSVQSTQKITSAMKMVAAAKLRRAQDAIERARPYARRMRETLEEVAAGSPDAEHPLFDGREEKGANRVLLVVPVTSDRGLAGAFNNQICKATEALILERHKRYADVRIMCIGKKAGEFFRRRRPKHVDFVHEVGGNVTYLEAQSVSKQIIGSFEGEEIDEVVIVHNEFVSTMTQTPRVVQLLPFMSVADAPEEDSEGGEDKIEHEIEPSAEALLSTLVPRAVEVEVFRTMLENQAGEHAARMTAMESATKNTEDLIEKLTLEYNRARQAAITSELVEIVTGAQALE